MKVLSFFFSLIFMSNVASAAEPVAKMVYDKTFGGDLCTITYTDSVGKKHEKFFPNSSTVDDCERDRKAFAEKDVKFIEEQVARWKEKQKEYEAADLEKQKQIEAKNAEIAERKRRDEERKAEAIKQEKQREAEKQRQIAAEKQARKIEGFNAEQSDFIHDAIAVNYVNFRNLKVLCLEEGSAPFADEAKNLFDFYKQLIKEGKLEIFPKDTNWDKLSDAAWKASTPAHEKFLKEEQIPIGIYESMSDKERVKKCLKEIMPQQVRFLRGARKQVERFLNEKNVKDEKKAF